MENPITMDDLGVPLFSETAILIYLEDYPGAWLSNFKGPFFAMFFCCTFSLWRNSRRSAVFLRGAKREVEYGNLRLGVLICRSMDQRIELDT